MSRSADEEPISGYPFSFVDQVFEIETLVTFVELLQKSLALLSSDTATVAFVVVEFLQTHQ